MPYAMAILRVEDYTKWKASFDSEESKATRKATGGKPYQAFRSVDDPNTFLNLVHGLAYLSELVQIDR